MGKDPKWQVAGYQSEDQEFWVQILCEVLARLGLTEPVLSSV